MSRQGALVWRRAACAAIGLLVACGGEGAETAAHDDLDSAVDPDIVVQAAPADSTGTVSPGLDPGGPSLPSLDGEGEARMYQLRLVNRSDAEAYVFVRAGARRVVLDTVPGRDSVRVDIRVRADRVSLDAEDASGRTLATEVLDLTIGSLNRWVIPASGLDPATRIGGAIF